jgi:hypothetical protein
VGGQLGPIVQDAELVVTDRHDDDLAAVACPTWSLAPATMSRPWPRCAPVVPPQSCYNLPHGFKGAPSVPRAWRRVTARRTQGRNHRTQR